MISVLRLPNFSRDNCNLTVARNPVETSQHNQRDAWLDVVVTKHKYSIHTTQNLKATPPPHVWCGLQRFVTKFVLNIHWIFIQLIFSSLNLKTIPISKNVFWLLNRKNRPNHANHTTDDQSNRSKVVKSGCSIVETLKKKRENENWLLKIHFFHLVSRFV